MQEEHRPPEPQEPQIDLREYWNILLKRRWTIVAVFVAAVTLVTIYTLRQKKIYEAKASVIIELMAPQVLGNVREVFQIHLVADPRTGRNN
ncbi:MAG TPA: Wzz/FepE/Etk N-terminal domain-containing protein [Myxococcota bacterium]|nr:Wzz/FepE/Etk N-terminal domain-containing protein [Myxococcota bacterium]